ncbi:MAG: hypothetical protein ACRD3K_11120 [Edaphobacter sp.]
MHDEQLDQNNSAAIEHDEHMDQRLTRALEAVPLLSIPADFAARVASRLPARRPVSLTPTHYGQNAMLIGIFITLAALLVLARHATGHASFDLLESLLPVQFVALAVWFTIWRHSLR